VNEDGHAGEHRGCSTPRPAARFVPARGGAGPVGAPSLNADGRALSRLDLVGCCGRSFAAADLCGAPSGAWWLAEWVSAQRLRPGTGPAGRVTITLSPHPGDPSAHRALPGDRLSRPRRQGKRGAAGYRAAARERGLEHRGRPVGARTRRQADPDVSRVSDPHQYLKDSAVRGGGVSEGVTNHAPYPINRRTHSGHRHLDAGCRTRHTQVVPARRLPTMNSLP
jgi:hypothetical protein